jgi:hypothetical protein
MSGPHATDPHATEVPTLFVGDIAELHGPGAGRWAGQIARIRSQRGARWKVELPDGSTVTLDPRALRRTEREFVSTRPPAPDLELGQVVTVTPPRNAKRWDYPADQRFVVFAVSERTVSIVKLGGDKGRYARIDPRACTPIPVSDI